MLPLLLAAASLGAQSYSMYQKNKGTKEQEAYARRVQLAAEREARKQALARAIGANLVTRPFEQEIAPDFSKYATRAGVADLLGSAAAMGAASLGKKPSTQSTGA